MHRWWPWFWPGVAFVVATLAALTIRRVILAGDYSRRLRSDLLSAVGSAVRGPSLWWCVVVGLSVANEVAEAFSLLPERRHRQLTLLLQAVVIVSLTVTLTGLTGRLIGRAAERRALGGAVTGLAQTASRAVVFSVGVLVLLSVLGIQVTPILAALGIGGVAVALGLQDTLANLFAGMHLLADRPIRVGDYVGVGDGIEGFVLDVGWRSTRIRTLSNNVIVVPNQTMARASITNYNLPEPRMAVGLKVRVEYGADPEHVETLLLDEVTRAVGQVPGLLAHPAPSVSLIPGFGECSLDFTVGYHVATFVDQYPVQHQLRKRILQRLHREGIMVPVRSV